MTSLFSYPLIIDIVFWRDLLAEGKCLIKNTSVISLTIDPVLN